MGTGVADVFIEYVSADRDRVDAIVRALKSSGIAAEWQEAFRFSLPRDEREQARAACKIVLIIWSQTSTASRFFQKEMEGVVERHISVPILVDDSRVPLWLREQNAFDLGQWNGHPDETPWQNVAEHITPFIEAKGGPSLPPQPYVAPGHHPDATTADTDIKADNAPTKRQPCATPKATAFVLPPELKSQPLKTKPDAKKIAPADEESSVPGETDAQEQMAATTDEDDTPFSDFSGTTIEDDEIRISADDIFLLTDVLYDNPSTDQTAEAAPAGTQTSAIKTEAKTDTPPQPDNEPDTKPETISIDVKEMVDASDLIDTPTAAPTDTSHDSASLAEDTTIAAPANQVNNEDTTNSLPSTDKTLDSFDALELAPGRRLESGESSHSASEATEPDPADVAETAPSEQKNPDADELSSPSPAASAPANTYSATDTDPLSIIPRPLIYNSGRLANRQFPTATLGIAAALALVTTIATAPQLQFWRSENIAGAADYTIERLDTARTAWSKLSETFTTTHPQDADSQATPPHLTQEAAAETAANTPVATAETATEITTASTAPDGNTPQNRLGDTQPSAHDQLINKIEALALNAQREADRVAANARIAAARARDNAPGHAILYYKNGSRYEGEIANGQRDGVGVYYYASGSRYEGQYKDDMRGALGSYHFAHGDLYQGHFEEGQLSGHGVYAFADGATYLGELFEGTFNGLGMKRAENGAVVALGTWHQNALSVPWQTKTTSTGAQTF